MIKTILLCLDGSKYSKASIESALWLSRKLSAQLKALSVADAQLLEGPWLADLSGVAGAQPFQGLVPQLREFYERKARMAVDEASAAAKQEGIACETEVRTGPLVETVLNAERSAELVVLGQRGEGFEATGEWLGSHIERIVRKSIKPCLVTPQQFRPIHSILTAYDGSRFAIHALYMAFELAKSLEAKLAIIAVETTRDEEQKSWALKEAMDLAARQGIAAKPLALHGTPEEKILEVAASQDHDLIVMGAYGHTRLRELILGSVTNLVIRKSSIPVLLVR